MTLLFPDSAARRLDEIVQPGLLCAFDFDGTLAPIVLQPDKACAPLGILHRLGELSQYAPVAVITGRSLSDIHARLGFEPNFLVGNHGLEGLPGRQHLSESYQHLCCGWEQTIASQLKAQPGIGSGVWIENKGCSLSVHYRLARDRATVEAQLARLFGALEPAPHVIAGKCVFNLLPENAGDKGMALTYLMQASGARSAIYVGDDVTDEDVFRLRRPDLLSVRIGHAPDTAAELILSHRVKLFQLLDELIIRLRNARAENWLGIATVDPATRLQQTSC